MNVLRSSILLTSGIMLIFLGGCVGRREMAARHFETCRAFGFNPGTDYFAGCMLQLEMEDHGYSHHGSSLGGRRYPPNLVPPAAPPPVQPPR